MNTSTILLIAGGVVAVGAAATAASSASARIAEPTPSTPPPQGAGRDAIIAAGQALGLPPPAITWLLWVAKGESNWSITAHNDSPGERAAAGKAYDRLVKEGRWPCPTERSRYAIGSGGWYGQLAPFSVLFASRVSIGNQCEPLQIWRDPQLSTAAHVEQVKGTLRIARSKLGGAAPTWLQLRALYGLPSRDPNTVDTPERRAQYTRTLQRAGLDPAFLDEKVPI